MLLFELFPAFMAIISALIGIALYVVNRRAARSGEPATTRSPSKPSGSAETKENRLAGPRRPSMSA